VIQEVLITLMVGLVVLAIAFAAVPDALKAVVVLVGFVVIAVMTWRAIRISVVLQDDGICVKNLWRRHRMRWSEVTWIQSTWTSIGPLPVRTIGLANEPNRRFIRVLAAAGSRSDQERLLKILRDRPELAGAEFRV
jgi:hypothetical protein